MRGTDAGAPATHKAGTPRGPQVSAEGSGDPGMILVWLLITVNLCTLGANMRTMHRVHRQRQEVRAFLAHLETDHRIAHAPRN